MADTLTDKEIQDEIAPDQFEAMFLQEATGVKAEEKDEPAAEPAVEPVVEPEPAPVVEPVVEPAVAAPVVEPAPAVAAKVEPAPAPAVEPEPAPVIDLTDDEKKLFESVATDFPEITKVLEAQKRVLTEQFNAQLKTTVAEIRGELAPVYANAQEAAQAKHQAAVLKEHPDALELLPEAEKWIASQPAYLQPAYNKVLDEGTVADVVAFFTQYKAAVGKVAAPPAVDAAAEAERQRKLAEQEGVATRRGDTKKGGPVGFEEAFGTVQ